MKFSTTLISLAIAATFVSAEVQPRAAGQVSHPRHHSRSDAIREKVQRREEVERQEAEEFLAPKKRSCKSKSKKNKNKSKSKSGSGSGSDNDSSKSTNKQASSKDSSSSSSKSSDSGSKSKSNSSSSSDSGLGAIGKGLFGMTNNCGSSQASNSDPNGAKSWLNCNMGSSGWAPPFAKLSNIKVISDDEATKADLFKPCAKYASQFKAAHSSTGIPVPILMSIAMQESSCNAGITGSRGESGLMQLSSANCAGAPGGNCHDPAFNIKKGAQYLKDTTDQFGGNFIEALGQYNGWSKGMKASGSCGPQGQNLGYLYQNLNGWFQGKNGYGSDSVSC